MFLVQTSQHKEVSGASCEQFMYFNAQLFSPETQLSSQAKEEAAETWS